MPEDTDNRSAEKPTREPRPDRFRTHIIEKISSCEKFKNALSEYYEQCSGSLFFFQLKGSDLIAKIQDDLKLRRNMLLLSEIQVTFDNLDDFTSSLEEYKHEFLILLSGRKIIVKSESDAISIAHQYWANDNFPHNTNRTASILDRILGLFCKSQIEGFKVESCSFYDPRELMPKDTALAFSDVMEEPHWMVCTYRGLNGWHGYKVFLDGRVEKSGFSLNIK